VRDLFVSQLAEILWSHKLSPETLRLPATPGVPEIQIFDLTLKGDALDDDVLHAIDRAVPYPVIHRLRSDQGLAFSAAFKRPSESDSRQWVVGSRFTTPFTTPTNEPPPLPIVLDLGHLYAALFAPLLPLPPRPAEPLAAHIARCEAHLRLTRQIDQLAAKVRREKQFNRRVALNQQLKPLLAERSALEGEHTRPRVSFPAPPPETGPNHPTPPDFEPVSPESAAGPRGRDHSEGEHTRPRVSFPAPSPETGPNHPTPPDFEPASPESAPGPRGRAPEHARARVLPKP
jgi:hypothetical protein